MESISIPSTCRQLPSRLIRVASSAESEKSAAQPSHRTGKWNKLNDTRCSSCTDSEIYHLSPEQHMLTDGAALSCGIIHPYNRSSTDARSKLLTRWSMSWQTRSMYLGSRSGESRYNLLPHGWYLCSLLSSHLHMYVINLCLYRLCLEFQPQQLYHQSFDAFCALATDGNLNLDTDK